MAELPPVSDPAKWKQRPAPWELVAELRIADLVHKATVLPGTASAEPALATATEALAEAWRIVTKEGATPATWWSGSRIERAWSAIHRAEAAVITLDPVFARAVLPRIRRRAVGTSAKGAPATQLDRLDAIAAETNIAPLLDEIAEIHGEVYAANDERHRTVRKFRNWIAGTGVAIGVGLLVVAILQALEPDVISLCGMTDPDDAGTSVKRCLDGGSEPRAGDAALVMLMGALGGLLSVGFALGRPGAARPALFDPARAQLALKALSGALAAFLGVLVLQSDLLFELDLRPTDSAALGAAALLGFAQHLITRYVDQRADAVLGETQPKDQAN